MRMNFFCGLILTVHETWWIRRAAKAMPRTKRVKHPPFRGFVLCMTAIRRTLSGVSRIHMLSSYWWFIGKDRSSYEICYEKPNKTKKYLFFHPGQNLSSAGFGYNGTKSGASHRIDVMLSKNSFVIFHFFLQSLQNWAKMHTVWSQL